MGIRTGLTALLAACLTGCQLAPPVKSPTDSTVWLTEQPRQQQWQGHFSVKLGQWGQQSSEGQSFTFYLQSDAQVGQLDLMTPLGTQLAQVIWSPNGTRIESAQGTQRYASLSDLSVQLLGEEIPLQALPHWLQGIPSPNLPAAITLADHSGFEQGGWRIDVHALSEGKLAATRPQTTAQRLITIKVRLER